eukprot:TRINITY_DN417_c0_g2_i1.p2 TRINITY_DN417_c0_g2~~TRINITY_DN417_c0_g2_i1.p2  ORF type:complete len:170 (+),score=29.91 TRINITY_DN417_c0_g2_i1:48-557(+)
MLFADHHEDAKHAGRLRTQRRAQDKLKDHGRRMYRQGKGLEDGLGVDCDAGFSPYDMYAYGGPGSAGNLRGARSATKVKQRVLPKVAIERASDEDIDGPPQRADRVADRYGRLLARGAQGERSGSGANRMSNKGRNKGTVKGCNFCTKGTYLKRVQNRADREGELRGGM